MQTSEHYWGRNPVQEKKNKFTLHCKISGKEVQIRPKLESLDIKKSTEHHI